MQILGNFPNLANFRYSLFNTKLFDENWDFQNKILLILQVTGKNSTKWKEKWEFEREDVFESASDGSKDAWLPEITPILSAEERCSDKLKISRPFQALAQNYRKKS